MLEQRAVIAKLGSAALLLQWVCVASVFCGRSDGQTVATADPGKNREPLSFEVASIKRFDPAKQKMGATIGPDEHGMRLVSNLSFFIEEAYGIEDLHITGLPAGTNGQFYEIVAKTAVPSKPAEVDEMLKTLLQDRFKLVSHFETKAEPIYSLVVSKGGLKMKAVNADDMTSYSSGPLSLRGTLTTSQIAYQLTADLHRTVVDNTGLNKRYLVDLKWVSDTQIESGNDLPIGASVFTAIQEQLGMKLVPAKGPVRTLVIDHVERPSDN
jgi:uncharacterized protein (TIGR03435 family)